MNLLERDYQAYLVRQLNDDFPDCFVLINDAGYVQGIPDLVVFYEDRWAMLEVKRSEKARHQPNQKYYVDLFNEMSYAAFIYPENEEEVFDALKSTFKSRR